MTQPHWIDIKIQHSAADHVNMRIDARGKRNCALCGRFMKRKYKKYCVRCEHDLKAQKRDAKALKKAWTQTTKEMVKEFGKSKKP